MAKPKQRENYGNGSITPELDKDGNQKKNRKGQLVWRVCLSFGCETVIVDDRLSFVQQARAAGIEAVCEEFEEALRKIDSDRNTWFVIMTRGHKWDEVCLREIAAKPHAYIGMMGSRRRVKIVLEHLAETGVDEQILSRVHTPIGLSIGAETPEEIAISVIAEIIQVNSRMGKDNGFPADILEAVNGGKQTGIGRTAKILMTIIRRTGSAPREAGARMLLQGDRITTVGTIGGGCVEAEALAQFYMRCGHLFYVLFRYDHPAVIPAATQHHGTDHSHIPRRHA